MAQKNLARGFKIYLLSLLVALVLGMLALAVVGGNGEPGTASRGIVVLVFFATLTGTMIVYDKCGH